MSRPSTYAAACICLVQQSSRLTDQSRPHGIPAGRPHGSVRCCLLSRSVGIRTGSLLAVGIMTAHARIFRSATFVRPSVRLPVPRQESKSPLKTCKSSRDDVRHLCLLSYGDDEYKDKDTRSPENNILQFQRCLYCWERYG